MRRFLRVLLSVGASVVPRSSTSALCRLCAVGVALVTVDMSSAVAGTVEIERASGGSIKVIAESATVYDVVAKLSESYGFRLVSKGSVKVSSTAGDEQLSVDGQFEGSLAAVLDRVLAKQSYFIEHQAGSKAGIASVVLYSVGAQSRVGTVQSVTRAAPAMPSSAGPNPAESTAVARYPQVAPAKPIVPPGLVPPIRRVQPAPLPSAARPTTNASIPVLPQTAPPRPVGAGGLGPAAGTALAGSVAAGATPSQSAPLRKRGGVIQ